MLLRAAFNSHWASQNELYAGKNCVIINCETIIIKPKHWSAGHWPAVIDFIVAARARAINYFPLTKKKNISIQLDHWPTWSDGPLMRKMKEIVNLISVDQINKSMGSIGSIIQLLLLCSAFNF